jgi:ribokinase
MVIVLGDLIVDLSLHIPSFPVQAKDLQPVTYLDLGPGGAGNVAIVAARFGLSVACLGEIGDDRFGALLLDGLRRESIDVGDVVVNPAGRTPVAGVLVDRAAEPAYLGYRGAQQLTAVPDNWRARIEQAQALFADGWVEYEGAADIILDAFRLARAAGAPTFFDPGPGNPAIDNGWHVEAAALATVLLATDEEAARLAGTADPLEAARALLANGTQLVVVKRSAAGCLLVTADAVELSPGFPVAVRDATGAGDSLDAAVIYGYLRGLSLADLGTLGNATGAAKVQKLGTGHNLPTMADVRQVLGRFGKGTPALMIGDEG